MFSIDFPTVYLLYIIIQFVCWIIIGMLYIQVKDRIPGTLYILCGYSMNFTGNFLSFARNIIPEWISIIFGNALIVSAFILLIIGLQKFLGKKKSQNKNLIILFLFLIIHSYFYFIEENLNMRNINLTSTFLIFSFQIAYLMLKKSPIFKRRITFPVGIIALLIWISTITRIIHELLNLNNNLNYFNSPNSESVFLFIWIILYLGFSLSIFLMYNMQLINNLAEQEEKFSKAFREAPFLISLTRISDGIIFEVNQYVEKLTGYQPNEIIGNNTIDLNIWGKKDRQKFISDLITNGNVIENEYQFRKKSGEKFIGLISAEKININNEQCFISIVKDISERKQSEYNLKKSEATLKELNSTKDKFFSIIAHDLKSPFNAILGFSDLLSERIRKKEYDGIEKYGDIINKSSKHAVNLLTNLMDWARAQTGRIEFIPEYIEMTSLINSVLVPINISAEQKSIKITHKTPTDLIVYADKLMLETIFRNLISNAIKFSHSNGEIIIDAEKKVNEVLFSVKDSGIGIDKDNLEKLFSLDYSYSVDGTANEKGTGLGLILCKDFINLHEGIIYAESEIGVGSTFYFTIPIKTTE